MQPDSVEVTIYVPTALADSGAAQRARVLLVLDAVRTERMTWRAAALALGVAPDVLLDLARDHHVPVVRADAADVELDMQTLDKLERLRRGA